MSDNNKYKLLDFGHDEINKLLKKIEAGMVLSQEQYNKLINEIGLNNISTFDLDYNKLENLPVIPSKVSELEFDVDVNGDFVTEEEAAALIQAAVENKSDKQEIVELEAEIEALLENKLDKEEGKSLVDNDEIARLAEVNNYDDAELKEMVNELQAVDHNKMIQDAVNPLAAQIENKLDKVEGCSLMPDAEIERLANIKEYDDSELKLALRDKVDNEVIEVVQNEIHNLNEQVAKKVDAEEGFSLISEAELQRLANVKEYDDTEIRGLLLDDEPYEYDMQNKHYVFACGHPVYAEMVGEELVITMGTDPKGMKEIRVPKDMAAKTIIVGGFGTKNINKSRHLASTYIHVKNVELLAVHGGNFFEGCVGKAVVIVEDSKVKEIIGGGDAGKTLDKRGAYKNVVGETEVRLNNVTGCTLCYGGGGGHCSVGKARVYANNSQVAYIFPCGANGMTLDGELYLNRGIYNYASQVNRGLVVNSKIFMNDGVVKNF